VQAYTSDKKTFQGLPCPSPAAFLALLLLSFHEYEYSLPPKVLMLIVIALGILMVSSIPYPSIKKSDFFKTQPHSSFLLVVLAFALIVMEPVGTMLAMILAYILFGIFHYLLPPHLAEHFDRFLESGGRSHQ
jgi:CDP-diacylglycerol--serine O-phosphatidyltransferase